ncbi:MAG TPA: GTPase ObgE [Tissierellia bacterium]|nr:GTPase ObgE [Tissierellia bacterium]
MFIDHAKVQITAGNGGSGAVSFRREAFVPEGGPDGGNGGRGGSIYAEVDTGMHTLMDFHYKRKYKAEDGANGQRKNMHGKSGQDLTLYLPQGTVIYEKETGKLLADLSEAKDRKLLAKGGKGGRGNATFKTSVRRAPDFATPGEFGQSFEVILELKSIADVGLVGFPNVGKSSLLARITKAKPKVADYHFTTLYPNLGVVEEIAGKSFIMADIPGIIEGAADGVGLGLDFLRHVERTRLILHVLDVSGSEGRDPIEDYEIIEGEIERFSDRLAEREQVVLLNKADLVYDRSDIQPVIDYFEAKKIPAFVTSTVTGEGISPAMAFITTKLDQIEPIEMFDEVDYYEPEAPDDNIYYTIEDDEYVVEGRPIDRLLRSTNFESYSSRIRFQNRLNKMGVYDELRQLGIQDGDTVRVAGYAFEYTE